MKKENVAVESHFISNPFEVFNLPPRFAIDQRALDHAYFEMQRNHHPDQTKDDGEYSSMLNSAYQTLKNPVKRAAVLLDIVGLPIPGQEGDSISAGVVLLEIFDFQEAIMACESADEARRIKSELEEMYVEEQHTFSELFDQGSLDDLPESYIKLCYVDKLMKQIFEAEHQFFYAKQVTH